MCVVLLEKVFAQPSEVNFSFFKHLFHMISHSFVKLYLSNVCSLLILNILHIRVNTINQKVIMFYRALTQQFKKYTELYRSNLKLI